MLAFYNNYIIENKSSGLCFYNGMVSSNEIQFLLGDGLRCTQTFGELFGAQEIGEIDGFVASSDHIQMDSAGRQERQAANLFVRLQFHHDSHRCAQSFVAAQHLHVGCQCIRHK